MFDCSSARNHGKGGSHPSAGLTPVPLPHHLEEEWAAKKELLQKVAEGGLTFLEFERIMRAGLLQSRHRFPLQGVELALKEFAKADTFVGDVLPKMASLALEIEVLFPDELSLTYLQSGVERGVELTRRQGGCLLCHTFFCTIPPPRTLTVDDQELEMQHLTFVHWFGSAEVEKIKCLMNYFVRLFDLIAEDPSGPKGKLIFFRRVVTAQPAWHSDSRPLVDFTVGEGTIEGSGGGKLQADFANEYIGGGVLGGGNVQEEIRFVISPECLLSMLCCDCMQSEEAIYISGPEQFSTYRGYGGSFAFDGSYTDPTPRAPDGSVLVQLFAVDAIAFGWDNMKQYNQLCIMRELHKAYAGFSVPATALVLGEVGANARAEAEAGADVEAAGVGAGAGTEAGAVAIATGNWGCGVFGGDPQLKSMIQWIAASYCHHPVYYYPFGDPKCRGLAEVAARLKDADWTTDMLLDAVLRYHTDHNERNVFQYLWSKCTGSGTRAKKPKT